MLQKADELLKSFLGLCFKKKTRQWRTDQDIFRGGGGGGGYRDRGKTPIRHKTLDASKNMLSRMR